MYYRLWSKGLIPLISRHEKKLRKTTKKPQEFDPCHRLTPAIQKKFPLDFIIDFALADKTTYHDGNAALKMCPLFQTRVYFMET